ncbi:hypothetical protein Tco_1441971 [Tanacetum coccineum]
MVSCQGSTRLSLATNVTHKDTIQEVALDLESLRQIRGGSAPATDKRRCTSQSKKATIATRSSTAKDKGKAPATSGRVAKKTTPRKKIVNLG